MNLKEMSVAELVKFIRVAKVYEYEQAEAELIRRFNEKDERIKVLEAVVKNYQETCEKMINR